MKQDTSKNIMLSRALDILDVMAESPGAVGITELSKTLGLSKASIYRILQTLLARGVVIQDEQERYALGYTLLRYSSKVLLQQDLSTLAEPFMKELTAITGETSNLGILERDALIHILSVPGEENLWMRQLVPVSELYCSSGGKLFLAWQGEEFLQRYFRRKLRKRTIHTLTTLDELRDQLTTIREEGIAHDREEYEYGLRCCAVPIRRKDGSLRASLSLSGPLSRIRAKGEDQLWRELRETARAIEAAYQELGAEL